MILAPVLASGNWITTVCVGQDEKKGSLPSFDYPAVRSHEIKPHRHRVPMDGIEHGSNQLQLTLTVSPAGDVLSAKPAVEPELLKYWPELEGEVRQWKFTPFEQDGKAATAEIEEYLDLVPPERLPKQLVKPPVVRDDSTGELVLRRSGCYGTCPSYSVSVSTAGIVFEGRGFVVASGQHRAPVEASRVRELCKIFVKADFYSMDAEYVAGVTDNPTYEMGISIDGQSKKVTDYVGEWVGMPQVIKELEEAVDELAGTDRWIKGGPDLVGLLQAEKFNFKTYEAQVILKRAAQRGQNGTVEELLEAGVPLKPMPSPKKGAEVPFANEGWLTAASNHPETLQVLMDAGASKVDQKDKDLALVGAARSGKVGAVQALLEYGANPNADLSKLTVVEHGGGMTLEGEGSGSILIYAAESGNPEMVKEILKHHPDLEARDREGKTATFAAASSGFNDQAGTRVECVRLLAKAGENVNARDNDGNTPLHETFLTDVEEELLNLGADVNARNKDGETPIFTTFDDQAIALFLKHGANLSIPNKKGKTVVEAATDKGPERQEVLRKAIAELNEHP